MVELVFHTDNGHGWLYVPNWLLRQLDLTRGSFSGYSYHDADGVFAEEDCDAGIVIDALNARGHKFNFHENHTDGYHYCRNFARCAA